MDEEHSPSFNFVLTAMVFETTLAMVALAVGAVLGFSPVSSLRVGGDGMIANLVALLFGLTATIPLAIGFVWLHRKPFGPFIELKEIVEDRIVPLFADADVSQLTMLSFAAGIGEELLFRGLIQDGLATQIGGPLGIVVGLLVSSLMFGLCHAMTKTYFWLATVLGFFLGVLFLVSDNLIVAMTTHAAYDLFAMLFLLRHTESPRSQNIA